MDNDPMQMLLAASSVPLFVGSAAGVVAACNDAACRLLRAPPSRIVGQSISAFDLGHSAERVREMHDIVSRGKTFRSASLYQRFDGSHVRVSTHISTCLWAGELHVLGIVVPVDGEKDAWPGPLYVALDADSDTGGYILQCAWCERVHRPPGSWVEAPRRQIDAGAPPVSHGICQDCAARVHDNH